MKVDLVALGLRITVALFLFTLTVLILYLIGSAQNFSEVTLRQLFDALRWLSWSGVLISWLGVLPITYRRRRRVAVTVVLGFGFAGLFAASLAWGSWVYPDAPRVVP